MNKILPASFKAPLLLTAVLALAPGPRASAQGPAPTPPAAGTGGTTGSKAPPRPGRRRTPPTAGTTPTRNGTAAPGRVNVPPAVPLIGSPTSSTGSSGTTGAAGSPAAGSGPGSDFPGEKEFNSCKKL